MTDCLRLVSHFPGRLRVRAKTFRILPEVGDSVAQRLREEPGVSGVDLVPLTGSLLIRYQPREVQLPRLVDLLVRMGGLHGLAVDVDTAHADDTRPGAQLRERLAAWDQRTRRASGGRLDLRSAVPGMLATAGVGALLLGQRAAPQWYDFFFWSFVTFVNLNPRTDVRTA